MSGYAAAARISGASPRFVVGATRPAPRVPEPSRTLPSTTPGDAVVMVVQGVEALAPARGRTPVLVERWVAFRERWSQLTFYLSSGDSWR